ncbi:hypothetical protein Staley_17 [Bacillus phage Staley]|uniref:Uncharacterized protein n=1 Tax=Bacillus phage Staley TaxID=1406792 RepID=U5PXH1_9CAUD|nr:hypothetical protein Staley_17 [Bacillus phage Staley]AGY48700.1 hypothetical protein Staley_17 [Bacillus phage Staley]
MINRTDSERLEVIIEKLGQIIDLLTPKETKINAAKIDFDALETSQIIKTSEIISQAVINKFTPGITRNGVIRISKDAHRILASNVFSTPDGTTFMYRTMKDGQRKRMCTAEFKVIKEKRKVICLMKEKDTNKVVARGIAKCDPADVFNADIGMAISLYRALGLNVPKEYSNVPNPTKYEIGQVIEWAKGFPFLILDIDDTYGDFMRMSDGKVFTNFRYNDESSPAKIIEDGVEM